MIRKIYIEYTHTYIYIWLHRTSPTRAQTLVLSSEHCLNHWPTKEVLHIYFKIFY